MRRTFKPIWGLFAILLVAAGVSAFVNLHQPRELVPWRSDIQKAMDDAGKTGKPVFLDFTASWCGPCQRLKTSTWADPDVNAAMKDYVPVQVDIDQNPGLAVQYHVDQSGIPTFVVLDKDQKLVKISTGYMPPDEFLKWLKG